MIVFKAEAIMANGGVLACCGANMVAKAAAHYSVPLICITGLYKLCPLYPFSQDSFNEVLSAGSVSSYGDLPFTGVDIISPLYDYVDPTNISIFITDTGAHQPSYVYRLLAEYYSPLGWLKKKK